MKKVVWYVVLDIETTGLTPINEGITEITALNYGGDFKFKHTLFNDLVNPRRFIPNFITALTGIDKKMIEHKFTEEKALYLLDKALDRETHIFVAHNARFEKNWMVEKGLTGMRYLCTRGLFLVYKDGNTWGNNVKRNYSKLKQVCEEFGVEYNEKDAHRAEYDVLKTAEVAKKLVEHFGFEKSLEISKAYVDGKGYGRKEKQQTMKFEYEIKTEKKETDELPSMGDF